MMSAAPARRPRGAAAELTARPPVTASSKLGRSLGSRSRVASLLDRALNAPALPDALDDRTMRLLLDPIVEWREAHAVAMPVDERGAQQVVGEPGILRQKRAV